MFLDTAYVIKYYLNEPDSHAIRALIGSADALTVSTWTIVELATAVRRHVREGKLTIAQSQRTLKEFRTDVENGTWTLVPAVEPLFWRTSHLLSTLPAGTLLRAGDAVQLASARECGEHEIWSNDRHLLAAAPQFGLIGRSA
jgi:predicted nucleic acid-binding protein